eukprot:TRINITY_DN104737_c0_g1_i1.p1 TRINITY_DN104737_c0_g1~~TRINITY_DN104737_c0_g1_i1.p1  ORF type:complete len:446 (-),score=49.44 TRINITY_DN104737_c0_g1_i1:449-1732(-)
MPTCIAALLVVTTGAFAHDLTGSLPDVSTALAQLSLGSELVTGPTVAPHWSAELLYDGTMVGTNFSRSPGHFYYDRPGERYRIRYLAKTDMYRPNSTQQWDQLCNNHSGTSLTIGSGSNGACVHMGGSYSDLFLWLAYSEKIGQKVLGGRQCDEWSKEVSMGPAGVIKLSTCLDMQGLPLELNTFFSGKFSGNTTYSFFHHNVNDPGDARFTPSFACEHYPPPPCQSQGIATLDVFRIWGPPEPLELDSRNTGDVLGDVSFVCTQGDSSFYKSKMITHWSVRVDTAFGQYALCNYNGTANHCDGQVKRVGRRSSQMSGGGPVMGQCSSNGDVGSQYSFPRQAKCFDGQQLGRDCAWSSAEPLRTVHARCVMEERGLLDACAREFGHAPFLESARIWEAAFASDDPKLGGCPDADREGTEDVAGVLVV